MHWYLVHTKPRQERTALQNLEQQGYECYLPTMLAEKLRQGAVTLNDEPLFPRYLFIRLGWGLDAKSWVPIRSTRGVSRLVSFGNDVARISDDLINHLKTRETLARDEPERLFSAGERVCLMDGPFAGIEGVYRMADGQSRALVLIELLSRPVTVRLPPSALRKVN